MKKWRVLIRTLHFVFNGNSLVTNMVAVIFGGTQMAALCMALSNVSSPVSRGDTGESHNFFLATGRPYLCTSFFVYIRNGHCLMAVSVSAFT